MGRIVAFVVVLCASCVSADLVTCDDGRACPVGMACDEIHHGCVDPDQLHACDGLAPFADCSAVDGGRCFDGVCLPRGCANGIVEPEELCDDGNAQSGDGCSADCASAERCGDGFTDRARGEDCDDGNTSGRDGCTTACGLEDIFWTLRGTAPLARRGATVAWDSSRSVLVMFGGQREGSLDSFEFLADTWEWNGLSWAQVIPIEVPPPRANAAMAYDPVRGRIVMFGGAGITGQLNDTWLWSGATWERVRVDGAQPIARRRHSMAWDPGTQSIIMYGGDFTLGQLGDTWRWTGAQWELVSFSSTASARFDHTLVTDAQRGKIILVGGSFNDAGAVARRTDTFVFEGDHWEALATNAWPGTFDSDAVYDPIHDLIVVRGRAVSTRPETWQLDGTQWRQITPAQEPTPLYDYATAFDATLGRMLTFGGAIEYIDGGFHTDTNSLWDYDGRSWSVRAPAGVPPGRFSHATAYDPERGVTIVFGGAPAVSTDALDDLWEWDGRVWKQRPEVGPGRRSIAGAAFDEVLHEIIIVGGIRTGAVLNDVWSWNGTRWLQRSMSGPPPRIGASFAYDTDRDRLVMFGGIDAVQQQTLLDETWEWDGANWHLISPTKSPSARGLAGMAYDPIRKKVVLFGGASTPDGLGALADTWEYDGTTWVERASPIVVEPRSAHAMVFDSARGRIVMAGGALPDFSMWEWDGTAWTQPPTSIEPNALVGVGMTYDRARREIIVTDGFALTTVTGAVWTGSYRGTVDEQCDSGRDLDGDGKIGCADEDCAGSCATCGNGTCDALESDRSCPMDCVSTPLCGDYFCTPAETCAGDCP